jgi:hypothetical protein
LEPDEPGCGAPSATRFVARSLGLDRVLFGLLGRGLAGVRCGSLLGFVVATEDSADGGGCAGLVELTNVGRYEEAWVVGAGGAGGFNEPEVLVVLLCGVGAAATGAGSGFSPGFALAGGLTGCGPRASAGLDPSQSNPSTAATRSRADGGNLSAALPRRRRHRSGCVTSLPRSLLDLPES